jgi:DNA-binding SARP family transcriptional activator
MKRLQVLLLGPPETRWDGQLLSIQRRYPRALLLYLASRGGMVSRHELLTIFWEEEPDTTARLRLRETLGKLKGALPDPSVLITNHDLLGLDQNSVYVDLLDFIELIRQAQPGSGNSQTGEYGSAERFQQETYQKLERAVNLWRGIHFLSGVDLPSTPAMDDWLMSTAQHFERQRGWAYEKLSELAIGMDRPEEALRFAQAALENDELNENLHEKILRILIQMGRRNEAREYFNHYRRLVESELQAPPSQKMLALEQMINLEGKGVGRLETPPRKAWRVRNSLESPLVGRQAQLRQLARAYQKGGGVFIYGESGLGKTRLVKEFVERLEPPPRVIQSRCLPNENNLSFQPIIDLSRDCITLEEWLQYPKEWVSYALPIIPHLQAIFPEVKPALPVVPEQARGLLMEAVRQMALVLTHERRLLVFLDDAQWADEATLATISYLLERPPFDQDAFLIIAVRDDQPNPDIDDLLHRLEAAVNVSKIHLTRLAPEDIAEIIRFVLGRQPPLQFAQQLAKATGGNPLFLLESLRALKDNLPDQEFIGLVDLPLADNLVALIQSRLHLLTPKLRALLDTAAVVGAEFNLVILERAMHTSPDELISALEELQARQLIELQGQNGDKISYRFIHDTFREVLLMEINPLRAKMLHGNVAHALETLVGHKFSDQAAILAHHFEIAGEWNKSFEFWFKAGIHSRHLFAYTDATRAFLRAQTALDNPEVEISPQDIAKLYIAWCEMARESDDLPALRQIGEKLLGHARQRQSTSLIGLAYTILCDASMDGNQYEDGLSYADRAIPILEEADFRSRLTYTFVQRGVCLYMLNRLNDAEEAFLRVLELNEASRETHVVRSIANTQYHLANIANLTAWPEKAHDYAIDALASFRESNDYYGQASVYSALLLSYQLLGNYREAVVSGQKGLELAKMIKADRIQGIIHGLMSMAEMGQGHIGPALEHAYQTISISSRIQHPEISSIGHRMLGDLHVTLKSYQSALACYQHGLAEANQSFFGADNLMRQGLTYCHLGEFDKGITYMQLPEKIFGVSGQMMMAIIGEIQQASVSAMLHHWEQAAEVAQRMDEITQERRMLAWNLTARSILGAAAFYRGNCAEAEEIFNGILAQIPDIPDAWTEIRAYAYLDQIRKQEGVPSEMPRQRIAQIFAEMESTLGNGCDPFILEIFHAFQNSDLCTF